MPSVTTTETGVFGPGELDRLESFFADHGYATLRGVFEQADLVDAEAELVDAQQRVAAGRLDPRHGSVALDQPGAGIDGRPFAHYVYFATQVSGAANALVHHPVLVEVAQRTLGSEAWLLDYE